MKFARATFPLPTFSSLILRVNACVILSALVIASAFVIGSVPKTGKAEVIIVGKQNARPALALDQIDHSTWDTLLQKYVDLRGNVNYRAWHASSGDRKSLDAYLDHLSSGSAEASASREGKLAFWINAYNAVTVRGILREYPTTSIKNHVSNFGGFNIWKHFKLYVGGQAYSLNDMEHNILRKMNEPRIHMAIVCASKSCPRLLNRAFSVATLESQLQENTRYFLAQPGNFRYDASKNRVYLSSIFKWYGTDFAPTPQGQLKKLVTSLPDAASRRAAQSGDFRVTYQKYDWGLNELNP